MGLQQCWVFNLRNVRRWKSLINTEDFIKYIFSVVSEKAWAKQAVKVPKVSCISLFHYWALRGTWSQIAFPALSCVSVFHRGSLCSLGKRCPSEKFSIMLAHAQRTHILQASLISFISYLSSYGKPPLDFSINLDRNIQFLSPGEMEFFFY